MLRVRPRGWWWARAIYCHINETLIDYETVNSDSDLLGFDNDTNVVDEDGQIERNDVIEDVTNERVERLWNLIPKSGLYLKNIIQFSGFADVDSMLRLKKPGEMKCSCSPSR